jgi:tetratricopeptide (TPR) repeat protein
LYSQAVVAQESKHDLAEGRRLLSQALSIRERLTPPSNTIEEAKQYLALADIYHALGRNGKAEPMYRHSLAILRNTVGPDSLETIIVIDHLALILMDAGRFVEAEPGLRKSVAIIEKEKGPDHSDLIAPLDKLAWICDSTHRGQEASDFRKRIETIKSKSH